MNELKFEIKLQEEGIDRKSKITLNFPDYYIPCISNFGHEIYC